MSRWSEQFENHPIHETVKQTHEWADREIEEINSEHEIEQRRLIKVLEQIQGILKGLDPEFAPVDSLAQLDNHMHHPNFWDQLNAYSSDGDFQHLRAANDHMNSHIPIIYQLAGLARQPEARKAIKSVEKAYEEFCKAIERTKQDFDDRLTKNEHLLTALKQHSDENKVELDGLRSSTETTLSGWLTAFSEAQTTRAEEHSNSQIERSKEFDKTIREINNSADAERVQTTQKHDEAFVKTFEGFAENVRTKTTDIEEKHKKMLEIYELVAADGVAGGYKKGADDAKRAAFNWSVVSMVCYGLILAWVMLKGKLGFGIANGGGLDWPVMVTTVSITAVIFVAAQFASGQSRLHRINEQRMRWFSLEVKAIDPFISSLPVEMQQELKKQLSERLFGQDRVADDNLKSRIDILTAEKMMNSLSKGFGEALKVVARK